MLIALTLFFVLVGLFVLNITLANLNKSSIELKEKNAQVLLGKLANSPEFSCGSSFETQISNCIDFDKTMVLISKKENYRNFWEISNIEIIRINSPYTEECTTSNYPTCGNLKILSNDDSGIYLETFISLCKRSSYQGNPYSECEIAKLLIGYDEN